jgi:hypothetical protein
MPDLFTVDASARLQRWKTLEERRADMNVIRTHQPRVVIYQLIHQLLNSNQAIAGHVIASTKPSWCSYCKHGAVTKSPDRTSEYADSHPRLARSAIGRERKGVLNNIPTQLTEGKPQIPLVQSGIRIEKGYPRYVR